MSELKVHRFITTDELFPEASAGALYYDKSEADKVIAHHKYNRCLAMALVWFERAENSTDWENELVSRKRFSKWLELAEQFKPNNSTSQ